MPIFTSVLLAFHCYYWQMLPKHSEFHIDWEIDNLRTLNEKGDAEIWISANRPGLVWGKWLRCVNCHIGGSHLVLTSNLTQICGAKLTQIFFTKKMGSHFWKSCLYQAAGKSQQQKAAGVCHATNCHTSVQWAPVAAVAKHYCGP